MKALDTYLQRRRIVRARPFLRRGDRVLDIGCADGALFREYPWLGPCVGLDPALDACQAPPNARLVKGQFPEALPEEGLYDAITLMAVLEHIPREQQKRLAGDCFSRLVLGGHVLITVPSPAVDHVIDVLKRLRLLDGMAEEQHYGFDVSATRPLFESVGFQCVEETRFQLGMNNFFAFQKPWH